MTDLSHWDLVDEFTAIEAACLIFGFDPNDPSAPTWKIEPILKRMRASYSRSAIGVVLNLESDGEWNPEWVKDIKQGITQEEFTEKWGQDFPCGVNISDFMELMGCQLTFLYRSTERQSSDLQPSEEVMTRLSGWFDKDTFMRPDIARWLAANSFHSKYEFDLNKPVVAVADSAAPKSEHHAKLAANAPAKWSNEYMEAAQARVKAGESITDVAKSLDVDRGQLSKALTEFRKRSRPSPFPGIAARDIA